MEIGSLLMTLYKYLILQFFQTSIINLTIAIKIYYTDETCYQFYTNGV